MIAGISILAIVLALTGLDLPIAIGTAVIGGQSLGAVLGGLTIAQDFALGSTVISFGKDAVKIGKNVVKLDRALKDPRVQAVLRQQGVQIRLIMAANGEYVIRTSLLRNPTQGP